MIVGLDFDNTIACYDHVFHRAAREQDLIPETTPSGKTAVRDYLRAAGREDDWTRLQGYVYGRRMDLAGIYPGVLDVIRQCLAAGIPIKIISHRTRHPYLGPAYDLHAAARTFLEERGLFDVTRGGLNPEDVFFEAELTAKLHRIGEQACTHYLDDLPEVLGHAAFPAGVERFLFDPAGNHRAVTAYRQVSSWPEFLDSLSVPAP
ncbi:hypothetical protein [Dongia sp.]|uniref:hypothetical protein n=1 Tax=Dongia sp. TaxID=1977262 RepID=UPI0035ADDA54